MKAARGSRPRKRKIVIVDDHSVLREALVRILNLQDDLAVCAEAGTAPEGMKAVVRSEPDAVVVDISLEKGSGLDLIKDIHDRNPRLPILALSMHDENLYAERALHAGARGYIMKREPMDAFLAALRKVLDGRVAVSEAVVARMVEAGHTHEQPASADPADLLTDRELEVFRLLGEGVPTRDIAARLYIAASTVESYRASIKQKLGIRKASELIAQAARFVADHAG